MRSIESKEKNAANRPARETGASSQCAPQEQEIEARSAGGPIPQSKGPCNSGRTKVAPCAERIANQQPTDKTGVADKPPAVSLAVCRICPVALKPARTRALRVYSFAGHEQAARRQRWLSSAHVAKGRPRGTPCDGMPHRDDENRCDKVRRGVWRRSRGPHAAARMLTGCARHRLRVGQAPRRRPACPPAFAALTGGSAVLVPCDRFHRPPDGWLR